MMGCRWAGIVGMFVLACASKAYGDGLVVPRKSAGSIAVARQEAIVIFEQGTEVKPATETIVLKIEVKGDASEFAWIVPFPSEPQIANEDPRLFAELFNLVSWTNDNNNDGYDDKPKQSAIRPVESPFRQTVGSFDITFVRENKGGELNQWLDAQGYVPIQGGEEIIKGYGAKNYVFACIKLTDKQVSSGKQREVHPLRFTFATRSREAVYYPAKLANLQSEPAPMDLYLFTPKPIRLRQPFGYGIRDLQCYWQDAREEADGMPGDWMDWSDPSSVTDRNSNNRIGVYRNANGPIALATVQEFFQRLFPQRRFFMTNLANASSLKKYRKRSADLWFLVGNDRSALKLPDEIPEDARPGGIAFETFEEDWNQVKWNAALPWVVGTFTALLIGSAVSVQVVRLRTKQRISKSLLAVIPLAVFLRMVDDQLIIACYFWTVCMLFLILITELPRRAHRLEGSTGDRT